MKDVLILTLWVNFMVYMQNITALRKGYADCVVILKIGVNPIFFQGQVAAAEFEHDKEDLFVHEIE